MVSSPPQPSRIEMIVPTLDTAGMEMVVVDLARELARRGHDIGITCVEREGPLATVARQDGIRVSLVPAPGLRTLVFPASLTAWLRRRRPDVVHIHSGAWLKAVRAARLAGIPRVVFTAHGLLDRTRIHDRLLMRLAANATDRCVAVSEPLRTFLVDQIGISAEKVITLPNGVDTKVFRPGERIGALRQRFGLTAEHQLVGVVARLAPVKNHALLLEAFARTAPTRPEAVLLLIGDGPLRVALEAQAHALGIHDRVCFAGEAGDPAPLYREFDLFVLPSLAEGTSISILEAMASGVCVVATDVGGNSALLDGGKAGVLVPSGQPEPLSAVLTALLGDVQRRRQLGRAARTRVSAHFNHDRMVDRYETLYRPAGVPALQAAHPRTSDVI